MCIQPKVPLLTRLVFSTVSLYACILAAAAPSSYFESPRHAQQSWNSLSAGTYLAEPSEGSAAALADSFSEASQDGVLTVEETLHHTSSTSGVQAADRVKKGGPSGRFLSFTPRRLSFCLLLVMGAGLLTALIKQVSAVPISTEEGVPFPPGPSEDVDFIKGREKLEKVKRLLPAAERLAAVLRSAEAGSLLRIVKTVLNAAQSHRSADALESSLTTALAALHQLHQRATQQAKALSQTDELSANLGKIGEWADNADSMISTLRHKELQNAVRPFLVTVRSVFYDVERISEIIKRKGERLNIEQRKFRNENDGDVLFSTASDLECLYTTNLTSRHLLELANQTQKCTLETFKAVFITERKKDTWGLDISFASLSARHLLASSLIGAAGSSSTKTPGDPQGGPHEGPVAGPRGSPDQQFIDAVKHLEAHLGGVSVVAGQLEGSVIPLETASSLQAALASNADILALLKQAEAFLREGAAAAEDLRLPSEVLFTIPRDALGQASSWVEKYISSEAEALSDIIGRAEAASESLTAAVSAGKAFVGEDLIEKQRGVMIEAVRSALNGNVAMAAAVARLKDSTSFFDVCRILDEVVGDIKAQEEDKKTILLASQKFAFLQSIENNLLGISTLMGEVEKTHLHQHLQGPDQALYHELRGSLEVTKRRLKDAMSVEEAAESAADATAAVVDMQKVLFGLYG